MSAHAGEQSPEQPGWQAWAPEGALALAVLVLGLASVSTSSYGEDLGPVVLLTVATAASVLLARRAPGAALALVWVTCTLQVLGAVPIAAVQVAVAVVAFGCARWGSVATVVAGGLSIPLAAAIGALLVLRGSYGFFRIGATRAILDGAYAMSDTLLVGAVALGMLVLAVPWLAGLAVRATARARRSREDQVEAEQQTSQAQEIARLRDGQARLAHDVHDVVGHSLAVILAQAESAQYLPDDDPARLKATLATIATSARSSLQDVRAVLGDARAEPRPADGVRGLVEGVRSTGRAVELSDVGPVRPLPPDLEAVAHRVVQEMLTNAVRHGDRAGTVHLERHWPSGGLERDLRIEVSNTTSNTTSNTAAGPGRTDETQPLRSAGQPPAPAPAGQGVEGMRRRLDAVGGRLDVRRRGDTFTATAWLPVSGR